MFVYLLRAFLSLTCFMLERKQQKKMNGKICAIFRCQRIKIHILHFYPSMSGINQYHNCLCMHLVKLNAPIFQISNENFFPIIFNEKKNEPPKYVFTNCDKIFLFLLFFCTVNHLRAIRQMEVEHRHRKRIQQ